MLSHPPSLRVLVSPSDPETTAVARLSRAEAYMALKQYRLALEDTEFCPGSRCSAEVGHLLVLHNSSENSSLFCHY